MKTTSSIICWATISASITSRRWAIRDRSLGPILSSSRSEEHTSELQSLMRISYAVFCLKKQKNNDTKAISDPYMSQYLTQLQHIRPHTYNIKNAYCNY